MAKLIALRVDETWDFVMEGQLDDPPEGQVVWELGALSQKHACRLTGIMASQGDGAQSATHHVNWMLEAVRFGLRGVRNLKDPDGNVVKIERDGDGAVVDSSLDRLYSTWIPTLGVEIFKRSSLGSSEEDEETVGE